ncbi:hypothetical protein ABMC88_17800 [Sulfitobacter sp. HNIBRBA2951]|uniref:hypothetical protein n=1 Tax=Sulfitobacter aquimarinus TaxID=3158557 RepID=UPI0032DEF5A6
MTPGEDEGNDEIKQLIDMNLKQVFAELEEDGMPGEITDLLSVLRAQDLQEKGPK